MKHVGKQLLSSSLCLVMLAGLFLAMPPVRSEAQNHGMYKYVAYVKDQGSCPSMQGMAVCGNYIYACKINGDTEKSAVVARVHKNTQEVKFLTNSATKTKFFSDFGHGNDIEVEDINGVLNLFVPTSTSGNSSLVRYKISGTTATKLGSYRVTNNGSNLSGGAIRVTHFDDTGITFLFKSGKVCYTGTLPISQTSGTLEMTKLCTLDYTTAYVNGVAKDTSKYSLQGMGYHDFKLYLPLSGHNVSGHKNISIILVYDLEGASGTIKPLPDPTFCITSSYYGALFEVESCDISPLDGRMYFSTNRRRTNSDTNHDGVSYITNWTYYPEDRPSSVQNYRWELQNNQLVSTTNGGNVYNGIYQMEGSIKNGTITNGRFVLSKPMVLEHNRPWILEWKSTGAGSGALLFATEAQSSRTGKPYVFRRTGSSLVSIGAYNGSSYHNYGLELSDYGINGAATHVYRVTNKINSNGSNMVYLSVDGKEIGPLNGHYIAGEYQNETSNWISGKDLSFSYFGTISYKISNCKIDYVQVWGDGLASVIDEPNNFRWEGKMANVTSTYNLSENDATLVFGSASGTTYTDCRYDLQKPVVLIHDRPWALEWKSYGAWSGASSLMAADHMINTYGAPYLFQGSSIIALRYHNGKQHEQWGVRLADYGISLTADHTYTLKNEVNADGSNTIYLYVDGKRIAPMDTYCVGGGVSSGTSNDSLVGKDFVFSHMGTYQHDISAKLQYIQVWENGKPEDDAQANHYRWETKNNDLVNVVSSAFQANPLHRINGSCSNGVYSNGQYALSKSIVLRHDRPWQVEWQCKGAWNGGGLLLSSSYGATNRNNLYIFRNSQIISIGQYTGSRHEQCGVSPSKHGIDHSQLHTYRLVNDVASNGTNRIYLYIDGKKIDTMTAEAINGTPNGKQSNWLTGKDFVFSYIGTDKYGIHKTTMSYIQVFEG